jgi:hypothetical protein
MDDNFARLWSQFSDSFKQMKDKEIEALSDEAIKDLP